MLSEHEIFYTVNMYFLDLHVFLKGTIKYSFQEEKSVHICELTNSWIPNWFGMVWMREAGEGKIKILERKEMSYRYRRDSDAARDEEVTPAVQYKK
jgi:hypothetical protein